MANEVEKKDTAKKSEKKNIFKRLGAYLKEMWGEVKKLSWMSSKDLVKNTAMVLVFVLVMSAVIWLLDFVFSAGVQGLSNLTAPAQVETVEEAAEEAAEVAEEAPEAAVDEAAEAAAEPVPAAEPAATTEG